MGRYYFLDKNTQQQGPVYEGEFAKNGITSDTLVWKEGMSNWQAAGSLPELSSIFQPQPKHSKTEVIDTSKRSKTDAIDTLMSKNPLFNFCNPYLEYIGKGKLFSLVYFVMAFANLLIPFVIIYRIIDSGFFENAEAKFVFAFILMWLVIVFACWVGFLLWWDRRKKVSDIGSFEFIVTRVLSDLIQTFGEWMGTLIGIIGAGGGLLASIFLGNDVDYLFSDIGMEFMQFGVFVILIGPVIGFVVIILSRFIAEQIRMLAIIANSAKEIATNKRNGSVN